jgi:hypothetical protein
MKTENGSLLDKEYQNIQQIFDSYGYGYHNFKIFFIGLFMGMIYTIHLSIYSVMKIPIDEYYALSPFDRQMSSSLVFLVSPVEP